jgi:molybdenum cofactor guanylyltransferase/molybdopterin-guanine dinucleotide biosynthesis protein MobB
MALPDGVVGVLLAGGRSSRMGGGDKCLRMLGGRTILARIIDRLTPQVSDIVINANGDTSRFATFGVPVIPDSIVGYAGPLAGVHAGLEWVKANRPDAGHVVTMATDTPFFPTDLVRRLLQASEDSSALRIAESAAGTHYVVGLWPVTLADALKASLERGERKVGAWTKEHGAIEVFFPPVDVAGQRIDAFFNINAPEDLAAAEALLSEKTVISPPIFGVVGWKNSGKTTLMADLIRELTHRGFVVSVIKHAHAKFEIDHPGRDSFKMREVGARQVMLSSPRRFALMRELGDAPEMAFEELLPYAGPCDLVLVEGYKREAYPKIEIRREGAVSREPLSANFPQVVAIVSDRPDNEQDQLPVFHVDAIGPIVDFIVATLGLKRA